MLLPECDDPECHVLLPKGVRIRERATISTRMSHIRNSAASSFHPDVPHPEFCSAAIPPGCLTSGFWSGDVQHSPDISHPAPDAEWERRAFQLPRSDISGSSDSTHPETDRHFKIFFCTVPRCSPEASRYLQPTFWDILRYFSLDICCLNPQNLLVTHQL